MKKIFILVQLLNTFILFGQPTSQILQQGAIPYGFTQTLSIASDNSIIFSGTIEDSISIGTNSLIYTGAYISRYDSTGQNLWIHPAGKLTSPYRLPRVIVNNFDEIYVFGKFDDTCHIGNVTLIDSGFDNFFIAKLDIAGTVIWVKKICNISEVQLYAMALDQQSNILLTGMLKSTFIYDNDTIIATGLDVLTMKLDDSGNLMWMKKGGGASGYGEIGCGIASDYAGNIYVTGTVRSVNPTFDTIVIPYTLLSSAIGFLTKYDPYGNALWAKRCGNTALSVTSDSSGNTFVIGSSNSSFWFDTIGYPGGVGSVSKPYIAHVNTNGDLIRPQFVNSDYSGFADVVMVDQNQSIVIGGFRDTLKLIGYSDTLILHNDIHPTPNQNGYVACFDSIGNPKWGKVIAGTGGQMGPVDADFRGCQLAFTGIFDSTCHVIHYNNDSIVNVGDFDGFIITDNGCELISSTSEINLNDKEKPYCYPNPFNDLLNFKVENKLTSQIILYDIYSRRVYLKDFVGSISLNTAQLAKGIYVYEVRNEKEVLKKGKVVKN